MDSELPRLAETVPQRGKSSARGGPCEAPCHLAKVHRENGAAALNYKLLDIQTVPNIHSREPDLHQLRVFEGSCASTA